MNQAKFGRNGDNQLVHMRPDELQALGLLAEAAGSKLTTNPQTGYPEAWSLPSWVLPVAAVAATAMTAGAAAPAAAGAMGAAGAGTTAGTGTGAGLLASSAAPAATAGSGVGAGLLGGSQVNLANSALLMNGAANPAAGTAATSASPGLLGAVNSGLKEYAPLMNAASVGINAAKGAESQPLQAPQLAPPMSGSQSIGDVFASRNQSLQNILAQSQQERMQRKMQRRSY